MGTTVDYDDENENKEGMMDIELPTTIEEDPISKEEKSLEMDTINSLGPMRTLVRLFDHIEHIINGEIEMTQTQGTQYDHKDDELPSHIQPIYNALSSETTLLEVKVFLLKLILNRPDVF